MIVISYWQLDQNTLKDVEHRWTWHENHGFTSDPVVPTNRELAMAEPPSRMGGLHYVMAYDSGLAWIKAHISGIRMSDLDSVSWIGDDAMFIIRVLLNRDYLNKGRKQKLPGPLPVTA